jgi:adenylate kinase family enzyme
MKDLIIVAGAPGSGKTTVAVKLKEKLDPTTYIDFGCLREWHLLRDWSNASKEEEELAFENLILVLHNYLKHGYKNIILTDLLDEKMLRLANEFSGHDVAIFTLIVNDGKELARRVKGESEVGERDSGFRDVKKALEYQNKYLCREKLSNEYRVDNTHNDPSITVQEILINI